MKSYISVKLQTEAKNLSSDAAIIDRSWSLMNEGIRTINLQHRRLQSIEPEDKEFLFRWWVDLQFLIVALRRFRKSAELATRFPAIEPTIKAAIVRFDADLPMLIKMRNVGEHIDDYAVDSERRRHREVERFQLQVGSFDGTNYNWLGENLNIDEAKSAALRLWQTFRPVVKSWFNAKT